VFSAFKNFGVTFIIALVIFGISAYFATGFVTNTMNSIMTSEKEQLDDIFQNKDDQGISPGNTPSDSSDPLAQIEGDSFSVLLVITDYRPDLYGNYMPADAQLLNEKAWAMTDQWEAVGYLSTDYRTAEASAILLLRCDKENGQYTYTYFSPESRVYTPTGYHTFGEVYSHYGLDILTEYVNALTGVKPTYELVIQGYNLDELVTLLGPVTVNLGKDIYFDGSEYTTQYEYTRDAVGADGVAYVEHIPNTYTLGTGSIELNQENIYILSAFSERSQSDITLKESYTVEAVKKYLEKLAVMEEDALRIVISQLTLNESEWVNIEGLDYEPPETEPETETAPIDEANPWWTGGTGIADGEEETGEVEGEAEEEEEEEEEILLFEPETPVFETAFTAADLEKISGILRGLNLFESVTVSYPGSYVAAKEDEGAYFEPNLKRGVSQFLAYRSTGKKN